VAFALAPTVQVSPTNAPAGDVTVTVDCLPAPRDGQTLRLLLSRREPLAPTAVTKPAGPGKPAVITFNATAMEAGEYLARLRVDGVESLPYRVTQQPDGSPVLT